MASNQRLCEGHLCIKQPPEHKVGRHTFCARRSRRRGTRRSPPRACFVSASPSTESSTWTSTASDALMAVQRESTSSAKRMAATRRLKEAKEGRGEGIAQRRKKAPPLQEASQRPEFKRLAPSLPDEGPGGTSRQNESSPKECRARSFNSAAL